MKDKLATLGNLSRFKSWIDIGLQLIQLDYKSEIEWGYYPNAVRDNDGNWYDAVQIGDQVWMVQNLRTTKDANGDSLTHGDSSVSDIIPYYYHVDGDANNDETYGLLYNISAAQIATFSGWRLPTLADFEELRDYMGQFEKYLATDSPTSVAKALASMQSWDSSEVVGSVGFVPANNNASAFSAKAAGYMDSGSFYQMAKVALFWASTSYNASKTYAAGLTYNSIALSLTGFYNDMAMSVRYLYDGSADDFKKEYIQQFKCLQHHIAEDLMPPVMGNAGKILGVNSYGDGLEWRTENIIYLKATSYGQYSYKVPMSPSDMIAAGDSGKLIIVEVDGQPYYRLSRTSVTFFKIESSFAITRLYYLSADGINTLWYRSTQYIQERLTSGTSIRTVNGSSLLGQGDVSTEDWLLEEIHDGTTDYIVAVSEVATVENITIDNTNNRSDVTMKFSATGLDRLYVDGDRMVYAGKVKVFRVKCYTSGNQTVGLVTEHELQSLI